MRRICAGSISARKIEFNMSSKFRGVEGGRPDLLLSSEASVTEGCGERVRGDLLSSLGGVVIRIRILMYHDVSCVYLEGYMYP